MQIVEYLYATLFGNDLHPRLEFLSAVSYPRTKQEYHLSVEPRKIFPPYISSIYRRNGNLSQSRYSPILVSRQSTLTRFLLSLDSIFRLMYPSYLINSSFHPYRIHDETPCYILTKKNKRACKVIRFALTDKVSNGIIFYFCRGNVLKKKKEKKETFTGWTEATVALPRVHGAKRRGQATAGKQKPCRCCTAAAAFPFSATPFPPQYRAATHVSMHYATNDIRTISRIMRATDVTVCCARCHRLTFSPRERDVPTRGVPPPWNKVCHLVRRASYFLRNFLSNNCVYGTIQKRQESPPFFFFSNSMFRNKRSKRDSRKFAFSTRISYRLTQ